MVNKLHVSILFAAMGTLLTTVEAAAPSISALYPAAAPLLGLGALAMSVWHGLTTATVTHPVDKAAVAEIKPTPVVAAAAGVNIASTLKTVLNANPATAPNPTLTALLDMLAALDIKA